MTNQIQNKKIKAILSVMGENTLFNEEAFFLSFFLFV